MISISGVIGLYVGSPRLFGRVGGSDVSTAWECKASVKVRFQNLLRFLSEDLRFAACNLRDRIARKTRMSNISKLKRNSDAHAKFQSWKHNPDVSRVIKLPNLKDQKLRCGNLVFRPSSSLEVYEAIKDRAVYRGRSVRRMRKYC